MGERDVWEFYEALDEESRDGLTPGEQAVAAICDFRQEVNSGGFDSYFRFWGGDTAAVAVAALPAALGAKWAGVLAEAMALFGDVYPADPDARADLLDSLDLDDTLDALDDKVFELEGSFDADKKLSEFLGKGSPGT